ncbi:hypothetical protein ACJMK2_026816 [Sinanodonta woodiana]|uniref:Uncharacterized protein n=1 Tax=Sinanodonta woodiana TaxID=1069815 RepID=A0ABD3XKT1_SINWO
MYSPSYIDENIVHSTHQQEYTRTHRIYIYGSHHILMSLLDVISVVIACIAVSITLYSYFVSVPLSETEKPLKVEPEDIHTQQQFINGLSERLYIVESRLSDIKQCTCRTDDTHNIDENLEFENRVIKSENDLSSEVNTNKEELKYLKDEFQKLKDQIDVKCGDIIYVQEEHKEFQAALINLNEKLEERSQFVEEKNAEVSQQMFQHNETLRDLNLHVENISSTLNTLNEYVKSQVMTSVSDINITVNKMTTKDDIQKLNEGLKSNVTTLERKLGEQLQSAEKKHIEMMQLILQHNETLNGLNVSVENRGTNLHILNFSVESLQTNVTTLERMLGEETQSTDKKNTEMMQLILQLNETLNGLNVSLTNYGRNLHNLNVSVESLQTNVTTLERMSTEKKNTEMMQLILQHSETLNGLNASVQNHGTNLHNLNVSVDRLQRNVTTLERMLGEESQSTDKKNIEMMQLFLQHNETLNGLVLSVEKHGSSLHSLNVSVENHGCNLRSLNVSIESHDSTIRSLNVSVENHGTNLHNLNFSVERLQRNVTSLERMLAEQSQSAEKKNIEIMQTMLQHNESLKGLTLSVENHGSSLHSLSVSVSNHDTNLHNLNVSVERLQTNVTTLERKFGEHSLSAEKKNIEMMQQMLQHNETLNGLVASVKNHGSSLHILDVSVTNHDTNLHNINVSVENLGRNLRSLNVSLESHDSTIRSLNVSGENIGISLHSLNVSVKALDSSLLSLKYFVDSLDTSLRRLNASVEHQGFNISVLNVYVDNLRSNVKQPTKNITGIYIENILLEKRTEHIVDNKVDKGSLIVVIMINTTLLVLVIIYLVASRKTQRHLSGIDDSQQQQSPAPYSTAGRIMSQVRANPRLERKLCVISFNEETHPLHMRMTQSVTQQLNQELEEFIIRSHEDILECPPQSLYFIYVDYNERYGNKGFELYPTLGLGDLRLTTVQAVQKMGVIFYVGDLNSRHLNPMKLYNEDLASVKKQRELSALNRLCRFISAYDQLTDNQKAHLRQIVVHELL